MVRASDRRNRVTRTTSVMKKTFEFFVITGIALTVAGASGTLYICAGTYTTTEIDSDNELHIGTSGQSIIGVGTVIIDATGVSNTCLVTAGYDNLTISNIDFRNAGIAMIYITQGSSNVLIDSCIFTGNQGGDGIYGMVKYDLDVTDITISNNYFHDMNDKGVRFKMDGVDADNYTAISHTINILSNIFADITGNGIYFEYENYSDSLDDSREFYGITITDNK